MAKDKDDKKDDKKGGKDEPAQDKILEKGEIKAFLNRAYDGNSISCAIALTKDDDALLLLHPIKAPKKLRTELSDKAKEAGLELAGKCYFGRIKINKENLLTITVNKEPPGAKMEKGLKIPLRKAGYPDFVINADANIENEPEGDEGKTAPVSPSPGERTDATAAPATGAAAPTATAAPATSAATPNGAATPPSQGDLKQTGAAAGANTAPKEAAAATAAAIKNSGLAWVATRKVVEDQLTALHGKMTEAYKDHGFGAEIDKVFKSKVEPVLNQLDESLAHALADVGKATGAAQQKQLLDQAQKIVTRYESYLASEQLIKKLDKNPFMDLKIEATLTKTLDTLSKKLTSVANELRV